MSNLNFVNNLTFCRIKLIFYRNPLFTSKAFLTSKPIYDYSILTDKGDIKICQAREKLGFKTPPLYLLRKSSIYLYESCTDKIDLERVFQVLQMEDTFNSWFCVTRWHLWMVACRCMAIPLNGKTLRDELIKRLWEDVGFRLDKLQYMKRREKYHLVQNYYQQLHSTMMGLDEGLLSDDTVMAGAIWRNILGMNEERSINPIIIDLMVEYSRFQINHLYNNIQDNHLLFNGNIKWKNFPSLPFNRQKSKQSSSQ